MGHESETVMARGFNGVTWPESPDRNPDGTRKTGTVQVVGPRLTDDRDGPYRSDPRPLRVVRKRRTLWRRGVRKLRWWAYRHGHILVLCVVVSLCFCIPFYVSYSVNHAVDRERVQDAQFECRGVVLNASMTRARCPDGTTMTWDKKRWTRTD